MYKTPTEKREEGSSPYDVKWDALYVMCDGVAIGRLKSWGEKKMQTKTNEEEEDNKVVNKGFEPKLILGGKEPPTDYGSDWLTPLEPGHVFYVQSKTDPMDFSLGLFRKLKQDGKVVLLESPQLPHEVPVIPTRFCNKYLMYQSCGIIEVKTIDKKENDDERHRVSGNDGNEDGEVERPVGEQEVPADVPPSEK